VKKKDELAYTKLVKRDLADEYVLAMARGIVERAEANGILLRLLGASAFVIHCPRFEGLFKKFDRKLTDVDVITYGSFKSTDIEKTLSAMGFGRQRHYVWHAAYREIYVNEEGLFVDVFRDSLNFSHVLSLQGRLELDDPTIPLADLLLEKLQIHRISDKDLKDMAILLLEHEIGGSGDRERIDLTYVNRILSDDWGFHYDALNNLKKTGEYLEKFSGQVERRLVEGRVEALIDAIERAPKSARWERRAKKGTRRPWYNEVGEIQQGV
jgi:hypothetical protein